MSVWVSFRSRDFWILLLVSELFLKKTGYEESHTIGLVLENGSESVLKNSVQKKSRKQSWSDILLLSHTATDFQCDIDKKKVYSVVDIVVLI